MLLSVSATDWSFNVDVTQGPGRFDSNYVAVEDLRISESLFNDASPDDRVQIYVLANGAYQLLGDFIIDEYTLTENTDQVIGTLSGRDSKAVLLERFPTDTGWSSTPNILYSNNGSTTYVGSSVLSTTGTPEFVAHASATEVISDIILRAGFIPHVNIDDFVLGEDFIHASDTSFGAALEGILEPLRVTEKYRADTYVRGDTIWVWQRHKGAPFGLVSSTLAEFTDRRVERQRPVLTSSIQILGWQYQYPSPGTLDFVYNVHPNDPYVFTYTIKTDPQDAYDPISGVHLYTINEESTYECQSFEQAFKKTDGRPVQTVQTVLYDSYVVYDDNGVIRDVVPKARTETRTATREYESVHGIDPSWSPRLLRTTFEKFVDDETMVREWDEDASQMKDVRQCHVHQITVQNFTTNTYWESTDIPLADATIRDFFKDRIRASESVHSEADEKTITLAQPVAPLKVRSHTSYRYEIAGRQIIRTANRDDYSPSSSGTVTQEEFLQETAPTPIPLPSDIKTQNQANLANGQIKCGSDESREKITLSLIGREEDACRIRDQVIEERNSWKIVATFTLLPDLNITEGMDLIVLNAPARWGSDTFFVVGRGFQRSADSLMMTLTGVTFI